MNHEPSTINPSVSYRGFVSGEEKARLFCESDVFCFPTYYPGETFGLVIAEAMAFGLPVLTTKWRGLPELLPPSYPWIVEPRSPERLAEALPQMLDSGITEKLRALFAHLCAGAPTLPASRKSCAQSTDNLVPVRSASGLPYLCFPPGDGRPSVRAEKLLVHPPPLVRRRRQAPREEDPFVLAEAGHPGQPPQDGLELFFAIAASLRRKTAPGQTTAIRPRCIAKRIANGLERYLPSKFFSHSTVSRTPSSSEKGDGPRAAKVFSIGTA